MAQDLVRFQLRLFPDQIAVLRRKAQEHGFKVNQLIVSIIHAAYEPEIDAEWEARHTPEQAQHIRELEERLRAFQPKWPHQNWR